MTRKRRRNLTDEEQSLWNRVAQKVKPLSPEKKRIMRDSSKSQPPPAHPPLQKSPLFSLPPEEPSSPKSLSSRSSATHRIQRIRKVKIEARLDLHGFTREQARLHVTQFLISCQNRGCLWVLVITGKGRRHLDREGSYETRAQGTLRDLVPQWLEEPVLQSVVSAYTTAKPQDGGSGALYIRLKRLS